MNQIRKYGHKYQSKQKFFTLSCWQEHNWDKIELLGQNRMANTLFGPQYPLAPPNWCYVFQFYNVSVFMVHHYYTPELLLNLLYKLYKWGPGASLHLIKTHSFSPSKAQPCATKGKASLFFYALIPIKMLTWCFLSANWQYLIHWNTLEKQSLCGWQNELELQAKHQDLKISVPKKKADQVWCLVLFLLLRNVKSLLRNCQRT